MGLFNKITGALSRGASADLFLNLESTRLRRGDELKFSFKINPKTSFKVRSIRFELLSEEHSSATVRCDEGSETGTDISILRSENKQYCAEKDFQEGMPFEDHASVIIPADAQPTYNGKNASHRWMLKLVLDIEMGMDISKTASLTVD